MANTNIPSHGSYPAISNLQKDVLRKLRKRAEQLIQSSGGHPRLSRKAKKQLTAERREFVERVYEWLMQDATSPEPLGADAVPRVMVEVAIGILNRRNETMEMDLAWWTNYLGGTMHEKKGKSMTYKQMIVDGSATDEVFLDLVSEWHDDVTNGQSLREFLGFDSLDEYDRATRPYIYEREHQV